MILINTMEDLERIIKAIKKAARHGNVKAADQNIHQHYITIKTNVK